MNKILVPTDFSACAEKALNYAVQIAQKANAKIILMHACELLHSPFADKAQILNEYNDLKTTELNGRLDKLKASFKDAEITTQLYDGDAMESILSVSKRNKVELIVMGTLGATGLKTVLFGTRTATIISQSTIPVIAIPFDYKWKEPKNILIAINDAEQDIKLFAPVFSLGQLFDPKIKIAVFSKAKATPAEVIEHSNLIAKSQEKLQKHYPESSIEMLHLSGSDFYKTLQQYIGKEKIDLLVMITHRKSLVQNLLRFSMTQHMAYRTTIPMLSMHSVHEE